MLRSRAQPLFSYCRSTPLLQTLVPQRRGFLRVVPEGEVAFRLFLGKNSSGELKPGLHLCLPLLHDFVRISVREEQIALPELIATTKDNVPVLCTSSLFFRIKDAQMAAFKVNNLRSAVEAVGSSTIRAIIGNHEYDQIIKDRRGLNEQLHKVIGNATQEWGTTCTKVEVQRFTPKNEHVERQMELQMEAERRRRQQELDTKAKINIAEGDKRSAELASEGALIARRNAAEGEYYTRRKEVEALCLQIEETRRSLGQEKTLAEPEHVTAFLLESQRIKSMQELAKSNNKSFFFSPTISELLRKG